jgi:hypothetical protein
MLPAQWHIQEEMYVAFVTSQRTVNQRSRYNFKSDPRAIGAVVLLAANESSYVGELAIPFSNSFSRWVLDNGTRNFDQGTPHPSGELWSIERGLPLLKDASLVPGARRRG